MEWIKIKDRLPDYSFIESDDEDYEYEENMILLFIPNNIKNHYDIVCGILVKVETSPLSFMNRWEAWNGENWDVLEKEPTHWMPLPDVPFGYTLEVQCNEDEDLSMEH